jgi:Na+-transporting methylmalonyl-CoA/oxaloacetate decarboxylase gamma subunit
MTLASSPAASQVVPGILGFLVVAGMGIVLYFLLRSMNKQLRKVVPDPQWKEEARQNQAQAREEQPEQDRAIG